MKKQQTVLWKHMFSDVRDCEIGIDINDKAKRVTLSADFISCGLLIAAYERLVANEPDCKKYRWFLVVAEKAWYRIEYGQMFKGFQDARGTHVLSADLMPVEPQT